MQIAGISHRPPTFEESTRALTCSRNGLRNGEPDLTFHGHMLTRRPRARRAAPLSSIYLSPMSRSSSLLSILTSWLTRCRSIGRWRPMGQGGRHGQLGHPHGKTGSLRSAQSSHETFA